MTEELKHMKIKRTTPQDDGSFKVETESYFEQLSSIKEEIEKHIKTDPSRFLSDIITCLSIINDKKSRRLVIEIDADERYQPSLITQIYTVRKERFKKQ